MTIFKHLANKKEKPVEFIQIPARKVPVITKVEVLVGGGGIAGLAAALSAAREGAKTILVEKGGTLGGTATLGLNTCFMGVNNRLVEGLMKEIIKRMTEIKGAIKGFHTPFDPEAFKSVILEMMEQSSVKLLLHTWISGTIMKGKSVKGIRVLNKSGEQAICAKVVVDATGDGDIAAKAGAFPLKDSTEIQPVTVLFRMGGVNVKELFQYIRDHPDQLYKNPLKCLLGFSRKPPLFVLSGFFELIQKAKEKGDLYLNRESIAITGMPREGEVLVNATRFGGLDGTKVEDLTKGEVECRRQLFSTVKFLKRYVPGFKASYLIESASEIGIRETRRIKGDYILTKEDVLQGRRFHNAVARNFCPIDIHGPVEKTESHSWLIPKAFHEIPYGCLLPDNIDFMLTAGRAISATHEAHGSVRSMPCCVATGQAAGIAAALSARKRIAPRDLALQDLRKALARQGIYLDKTQE